VPHRATSLTVKGASSVSPVGAQIEPNELAGALSGDARAIGQGIVRPAGLAPVAAPGAHCAYGGSVLQGNQSGRSRPGVSDHCAGRFSKNAAIPSAASAMRPVS
jgi:hypothetical protein